MKKKKKEAKRRRLTMTKRLLAFVVALLLGVSVFHVVSNKQASAAAGDVPAHSKTLTVNDDGTYTIALNVTGDSEKNPQKVNVIVIVDRSGSMSEDSGTGSYVPSNANWTDMYGLVDGEYVLLTRQTDGYGPWTTYTYWYNGTQYTGQRYLYDNNATRIEATQAAVNGLARKLLGYNGQNGNPTDTVEMALVSFATTARTDVASTTSYDTFSTAVNNLSANGGTNWEDGLQEANGINFGDKDQTFVIFFSDGAPTFHVSDGGYNNWNRDYGVYGSGGETEPNMERSYTMATDDAATLANKVGTDRFYTIFAYGTSTGAGYMSSLTTAAGAPADNNFSAESTAELNEAFAQILESIEMSGIGNVGINDGTTSSVTTTTGEISHLLDVDTSSYKYYRAGGLENGEEKYDHTANGGLGEEWTDAPAATFENGAVKWNIEGVLEDDVTYTVTFDCWPSQETLDIVADIKNDPSAYDKLDDNVKNYVDSNGNLKTNTTASLTYTDTRTGQTGSSDFKNPDPVKTTAVEELAVSKKWENELDGQAAAPITLTVTRDGKDTYDVTLSDSNNWTDGVFISIGIMRTNGEEVELLTTGHNFTFTEPAALGYYWELDVPTVRPMIVDGELKSLVKIDAKHPAPAGAKTYTIPASGSVEGGEYYVQTQEAGASAVGLTAVNHRRARLNLTKVVDGPDADPKQTFPFTLNVVDSKAAEGSADNLNSDYYVWFSVYNGGYVDAVVSGAEKEMKNGAWTGYYYAPSGTNIVVNLKAGDNLRFLNLPTDSTYTFTEGTLPANYTFTKAELTAGEDTTFNGAQTTTGTIQSTNMDYSVAFTNTYALSDVEITKVWVDNNDQDGKRPTADEFKAYLTLKADGTDVTAANADKLTVTVDPDDSSKYLVKWTGLNRYADGKEITYTVEETAIEGYTTEPNPAAVEDKGTITNTHEVEKTTVSVTKAWDDADNQDGIRPGSVTVQLNANGTATGDPVALNEAGSWTYTWENLDKYANGKEIAYTITETQIPEGYTCKTPTVNAGGTITNVHTPETVDVTVTKVWEDEDNAYQTRPESISVQLTAGGTASGEAVTLNEEGNWTYTWNDLPKNAAGQAISYAVKEVEVPGNYSSSSSVTQTDGGFAVTVTNTYSVNSTTVSFPVHKELSVPEGLTGPATWSYTINVAAQNGAPAAETMTGTVSNTADTVTFGPFTYEKPGTYVYTVSETGTVAGVTNDDLAAGKTVTVTVVDNGDGTLTATANSTEESPLTFTNTYSVEETTASFPVKKILSVPEGLTGPATWSYTVNAAAAEGAPVATTMTGTVSNTNDTATFGPITYTTPGTYTYTVSETGEISGVTNDAEAAGKTVTVTVVDNGDGTLTATADSTEENPLTFTNTYNVQPATASFPVEKILSVPEGLTGPADWSYTVDVAAQNGAPAAETMTGTVTKTAPTVTFGDFTYTAPGTYTYTVSETGTVAGVTNDAEAAGKTVTVTVTDNGDGTLTATASATENAPLTFTNTYGITAPAEIDPPVVKEYVKNGNNAPDITGRFTFTLTGADGAPMPEGSEGSVRTITNTDAYLTDGGYEFGVIQYTVPGTYTYTVKESGTVPGVTNDPNAEKGITLTVNVVDNGDGTLTATPEPELSGLKFTNTYDATGKAEIRVNKALAGAEWPAGKSITFTLTGADGAPMPETTTATLTAAETAVFGPIVYTGADAGKTYTYTISEGAGFDAAGWSGSGDVTATVAVTDNGDGTLTTDVQYANDIATITNTYVAEGSAVLKVTKALEGAEWPEGQKLTFTLAGQNNAPMPETATVEVTAAGEVAFPAIAYTQADIGKTYTYTISEDGFNTGGGWTKSDPVTATVSVADVGDGTLNVTVEYTNNATITNTYTATGETTLNVTKTVTGAAWPEGRSITLTLTGADGAPMPEAAEVTLNAAGNASFGPIAYTEADAGKTYTYTISEGNGFGGAWTGSGDITATVKVTDNGNGKLTAETTYSPESAVITNTYAAAGRVELTAKKELTGRTWKEGETVTFTLLDSNGAKVEEKTIGANGTITFTAINYTQDDLKDASGAFVASKDFVYTISETSTLPGGVTKSGDITATVTVTNNGDGTLGTSVAYTAEDTIINTYTASPVNAQINVSKTIDGFIAGQDADGNVVDRTFNFTMTGPKLDAPLTASITTVGGKGGPVPFDSIEYTLDDLKDDSGNYVKEKEFTYTVTETAETVPGFTFDTNAYQVVVTVTDNQDGTLSTSVKYAQADATNVNVVNEFVEESVDVQLHLTKVIDDQSASAEDATFTFQLKDADGNVVEEKQVTTSELTGTVDFTPITYTAAGTYNYTLQEVAPTEGTEGWTYDTKEHPVVVTVANNFATAVLEASATIDGEESSTYALTVTNVYKAAATEITLQVTKAIEDTSGSAYETTFDFTLKDAEGTAIDTASVTGSGVATFPNKIAYDKAGTYTYSIQEIAGNAAGYTYDTDEYPVVVTVEDVDGKLVATAAYGDNKAPELTVTNIYDPEDAKAAPQARKVVDDQSKSAPDEEFTFVLKDAEGKEVETVKAKAGYVNFSELTFDKVGTYDYTIEEVSGSTAGFTYDTEGRKLQIAVTDEAGTGILKAAITYLTEEGEAVITNPYKAEPTSIVLEVQKTVEGTEDVNADAEPKGFAFDLIDADGIIMETKVLKVLKGTESVSFTEIPYEQAGTYTYTIREKDSGDAGYTYDTTAHTVTVTVTDNAGKLEAKTEIDGTEGTSASFVNVYKPEPVTVDLEVRKELQGRDLKEGEFEFTLEIDGEAVETVANAADGTAKFATLTYDKVGEHTVKITEVKGELGGVTYDEKEYTGTIKITDDGEGQLAAAVELSEDSVVFVNTYKPEPVEVEIAPDAKKELTGRDLKEGEFEFTLEIDGEVVEIVKNAKDGSITFNAVKYEEVGEHTFRIYETKGTDKDVSYDTTVYEGKIVITDDLEGHLVAEVTGGEKIVFKNKYNPPVIPPVPGVPTGDSNNTAGWLLMMLASGTALASILVSLNRDKARAKARARARARRRAERER